MGHTKTTTDTIGYHITSTLQLGEQVVGIILLLIMTHGSFTLRKDYWESQLWTYAGGVTLVPAYKRGNSFSDQRSGTSILGCRNSVMIMMDASTVRQRYIHTVRGVGYVVKD
jgi:hypothetical protein